MKPISFALITVACAAGLTLTSCVDPYYAGGGGSVTTTTYSPGYVVNTLPPGYSTVTVSGSRYYRHNDIYYRPRGNSYVVVRSPYGDRDRDGIPNRYDRNDRRGDRGRDWDRDRGGNWDRDRGGYGRNDGPRGGRPDVRVIQRLPGGHTRVTHRGQVYYRSGSSFYQQRGNGYYIVPSPF